MLLPLILILYVSYSLSSHHVTDNNLKKGKFPGLFQITNKVSVQIKKLFIILHPKTLIAMKTFTQATDTQLVHLFQAGDNNALEVLVNRHKDKIFTSINILVKDKYLAEDLFQDVFIKIIDTLRSNRYNDEGKFYPGQCV